MMIQSERLTYIQFTEQSRINHKKRSDLQRVDVMQGCKWRSAPSPALMESGKSSFKISVEVVGIFCFHCGGDDFDGRQLELDMGCFFWKDNPVQIVSGRLVT